VDDWTCVWYLEIPLVKNAEVHALREGEVGEGERRGGCLIWRLLEWLKVMICVLCFYDLGSHP